MQLLHRKESLIITAVEVINDYGIKGFATREIAKRQNISEGTLFRHFKTKNDLLLAVLDYYSKYDQDIIESVKMKKLKAIDSIFYFIKGYVEYYENYPEITSITQEYGVIVLEEGLADKMHSIYKTRYDFLNTLIEEAKREGELPKGLDSNKFTTIIKAVVRESCLEWRMEKYQFSLKDKILTILEMLFEGFSTKK